MTKAALSFSLLGDNVVCTGRACSKVARVAPVVGAPPGRGMVRVVEVRDARSLGIDVSRASRVGPYLAERGRLWWVRGFGALYVKGLLDGEATIAFSGPWHLLYPVDNLVRDVLWLRGILLYGMTLAHAAGFVHRGEAVLLAGWMGSGKTYTVLRAAREWGSKLLGDDLVQVVEGRVAPYPKPLKLSLKHLEYCDYKVGLATGVSLRVKRLLERVPVIRRHVEAAVYMDPRDLGIEVAEGSFRVALALSLVRAHRTELRRIPCEELVCRILASNIYERSYWTDRVFAPLEALTGEPDLSRALAKERELLAEMLHDAQCFELRYANLPQVLALLGELL